MREDSIKKKYQRIDMCAIGHFFNGMYIAPNGKVFICCAMQGTYSRNEVSVGDVHKESLEQKYEKFKICQSCIEWANNRMEEDGSGRNNGIVHRK
ncbi:hypothetical protein LS72_002325 [Helicobacter apodemus]|uniref:4Fe4S-binding SPASM domain-containing protein n=2 Tax=Helicobacter apodemus TaxID=135569 RepID=A0A4U8UG77_9HELI|nr:hypothetical protein LS72_002325 [Helicobacter apodemus]